MDSDSVMSVAAFVARDDRFETTFLFWISTKKMKTNVKTIISMRINKILKIQKIIVIQCLIWCCLPCCIPTVFIGDCCDVNCCDTGNATYLDCCCIVGVMELFFY